jgi:membrane-bound ClpP family serine protease
MSRKETGGLIIVIGIVLFIASIVMFSSSNDMDLTQTESMEYTSKGILLLFGSAITSIIGFIWMSKKTDTANQADSNSNHSNLKESNNSSVVTPLNTELESLERLHNSRSITTEEYNNIRKRLISKYSQQQE